jgi:hypothetical protein
MKVRKGVSVVNQHLANVFYAGFEVRHRGVVNQTIGGDHFVEDIEVTVIERLFVEAAGRFQILL